MSAARRFGGAASDARDPDLAELLPKTCSPAWCWRCRACNTTWRPRRWRSSTSCSPKMRTGGFFGADAVAWFNGGLFDEATALPLEREDST